MSDDERLCELLLRWEELEEHGQAPSPEELCRDCPELLDAVRRRVQDLRDLGRVLAPPTDVGLDSLGPGSLQTLSPGQPARPPLRREVPGFEILEELGRGGMGVVYKARQTELGRVVALKMILAGAHAGAEERARFKGEAEAAARLHHPNIVQVFEVGEQDGCPWFALEYVEGCSLAELRNADPLPSPQAAALVAQLARAVHYAHQRGIVHRDLKPANILLTPEGVPKVADFGLAKRLDADQGHTRTGDVVGTPSYMAPEQAAGEIREIGPATDVYALGAILYELLTGAPPFAARNSWEVIQQVLSAEPVPPARRNPRVPRDLETICLKCLEKDRTNRYATAEELAEELERFLRGEPVKVRPVGQAERFWRWARRNPVVAGLSAAVLFVLVAGTVVAWALALWALRNADEATRALQHERQARKERALAQVEAVLEANPQAVPALLRALAPYREDVEPLLRQTWNEPDQPAQRPRRMRAGLALLAFDPTVEGQLFASMMEAEDPEEMLLLRDSLLPHRENLRNPLWRKVDDPATPPAERFHALVALAAFDHANSRWRQAAPLVLEPWLSAKPLHLVVWTPALRPVREFLLGPLGDVFQGRRVADRRHLAAYILADFAADRPALVADLLAGADERQFAILFPVLRGHRQQAVAGLKLELDRPVPPLDQVVARDRLARRQAQAAVALLMLGEEEPVWPLLRHGPDPSRRSYLVSLLARLGASPTPLLRRLEVESDGSARQALVLSLGQFSGEQLPAAQRAPVVSRLLGWYRDDPDPGIHGAVDWLLRHDRQGPRPRLLSWGQSAALERIDRERRGRPAGDRRWYVTREGHTLAVVPGPVTFRMGSFPWEPDWTEKNQEQVSRRIPRSFAIGTKSVTVGQFRRFLEANPDVARRHVPPPGKYVPDDDGPVVGVTWYEAAGYCNWLSRQEGIAEDQWCYPAGRIGNGMELPGDCLERTGYRLPTDAEWEYACRAGAVTSRCYGSGEALLGEYAWCLDSNTQERPWPVGQLKPNDLGLFDVHGNAWNWCQDSDLAYRAGDDVAEGNPRVTDLSIRVLRGASFHDPALGVRCGTRTFARTDRRVISVGLRVARTWR